MDNTNTTTPPRREKIDNEGNYLPFSGYTMVSHIMHPPPKPFTDLVNYLSSSELQKYYSFLPTASYHVTINPLENVQDEHKSLLHDQQRKLIEQNSSTMCTAEKLIRSKTIQIEVQFKNDDNNRNFENVIQNVRSIELQQANILKKDTMPWHLTLAYQYKNIEDDETKTRLDQIIENIPQSSSLPFDIPLDHIRICHFDDMTQFTPIQ
jgi:hypothetical protein